MSASKSRDNSMGPTLFLALDEESVVRRERRREETALAQHAHPSRWWGAVGRCGRRGTWASVTAWGDVAARERVQHREPGSTTPRRIGGDHTAVKRPFRPRTSRRRSCAGTGGRDRGGARRGRDAQDLAGVCPPVSRVASLHSASHPAAMSGEHGASVLAFPRQWAAAPRENYRS